MKRLIDKIKCFFGFHNWNVIHEGPSHRNLIHLNQFADTIHICSECYIVRNYLHESGLFFYEAYKKGLLK
jgi:hypothetical protein